MVAAYDRLLKKAEGTMTEYVNIETKMSRLVWMEKSQDISIYML